MDRIVTRRTVVGAMAGGMALAATGLTQLERVSAAGSTPGQKGRLMAQGTPVAEATPGAAPTVVLVHGAFADASGWAGVITRLQADGITTIAPANPQRGISFDAAYIASVANQLGTPVLLVGHSYGGAVITAAGVSVPSALGLVYIDGFAPDEGETLLDLTGQFPSEVGPALRPAAYPNGPGGNPGQEFYIDQGMFHDVFCADLPAEQAAYMAVSQRPISEVSFGEPMSVPAWKTLPSWFAIGTADVTIGVPALQFFAERAGSITTEIEGASHVPMISQPDAVAELIISAYNTVTA
jgi:pimeloyl-ACP methyl ester carboxylesterase